MLAGQKRKRSMSISESMTKSKEQLNIARYTFAIYRPYPITALCCNPEKTLCAVARENGQLEIWKISSWTMLYTIPSKTGIFHKLIKKVKL